MLGEIAIKLQTNVVNNNYRTFYYFGIIFNGMGYVCMVATTLFTVQIFNT